MAIVFDNYITELLNKALVDITHIGIGDGSTALVASETLLGNETLRKTVTETQDGNSLIFEGFWDETEGNGTTFTEAGLFWDGATNTINTGSLVCGGQIHVIKDATQTMTVSIELTIEAVNT